MAERRLNRAEQLQAINNGIAETIAQCSDAEIIAEINEDDRGKDLLGEAANLRKMLLKTASEYPAKSQHSAAATQRSKPLPTPLPTPSLKLSDSRNILIRNTNPSRAEGAKPADRPARLWRRSIMPTLSPALALTVFICSLLTYTYSYLEQESANNWLKAAIINSRQIAINSNRSTLPSSAKPVVKPLESNDNDTRSKLPSNSINKAPSSPAGNNLSRKR